MMNQLAMCSLCLFFFDERFLLQSNRPFCLYQTRIRRRKILNSKEICDSYAHSSRIDLGIWYQCVYRMNIDTELNRHRIVRFANALHRRIKWRHRLNVDECKEKH